jgi:mannose-6-phosphate isomerase-like protein (cupin superfamily)
MRDNINWKVWGYDQLLVEEPEYCLRKLYVERLASCSLHMHGKIKETLYLEYGYILLEHNGNTVPMEPGMSVTIGPGEMHRIKAMEPSLLFEISTGRNDVDIIVKEHGKEGNYDRNFTERSGRINEELVGFGFLQARIPSKAGPMVGDSRHEHHV